MKGFTMEWLLAHMSEVINAVTAVVAACSLIANLTPTDADNKVVAFVSKIINTLALNFKK